MELTQVFVALVVAAVIFAPWPPRSAPFDRIDLRRVALLLVIAASVLVLLRAPAVGVAVLAGLACVLLVAFGVRWPTRGNA